MWNLNFILSYIWIIICVIVVLKLYMKFTTGWYNGKERLDGKTVIITGANTGIGLCCAKDFAKRGAKLIMVCRDMNKAKKAVEKIIEETGNDNIKLKHIDFLSFDSIRNCANEILQEEDRIDILLNNAGARGTGFKLSDDGINMVMQTNYFGPFLFTNILLGKIIESSPSRIVNVSSVAHKIGKVELNHLTKPKSSIDLILYGSAKLATMYFNNELHRRLRSSGVTGVTVNSLHPGVFYSEMCRNAGSFNNITRKFIIETFLKNIEEGAQTSIYLCVSPEVENISGKYFSDCKLSNPSAASQNKDMARKLWDLTEKIIDLKDDEKHY